MSEMVERLCARAMAELKGGPTFVEAQDGYSSVTIDGVFDLKAVIVALIDEMREPTAAMLAAGDFVPYPRGIWERMIDAARGQEVFAP